MPLVEPALERVRVHAGCAAGRRLDGWMIHADDLALELYQHAAEGLRGRPAFLGFEVCKARIGAQAGHKAADGVGCARQEQVDALGRQQDGAHEAQRLGAPAQVFTQHGAVVDGYEFVSRNIQNLLHGGRL